MTHLGGLLPRSAAATGKTFPATEAIGIEIFTSFGAAEQIWRAFEKNCFCHVFQSFDWLAAWQRTVGAAEKVEPRIVHVTAPDGATLMLVPLGIWRRRRLSFLSFLGGVVTDYHAPLLASAACPSLGGAFVADMLAQVVARLPRIDVLAFERMPASLGPERNPFVGLAGVTHVWSAHLARLPSTFAAFQRDRKSKLFSDTARRWRLLTQQGEARLELAETQQAREEIFAAFARQKSRRWDSTGARNLFARPGYLAFYRWLAESAESVGPGHLSALRVGDAIVATHLGAVFRGRFYYLMPAHEAGDWGRYSVGRQLMRWLLERSIAAGLTEFDFTVGDEAFKAEWADVSVPLHDYLSGVTWRGHLYCSGMKAREWLRVRAKRIPWLRQQVRRLREYAGSRGSRLSNM